VILPGGLHVARRTARVLRRGVFSGSFDRAFELVVEGCARRHEPGAGTWITDEMARAYLALHRMGHAHSVEIWQDEELAGGLYGVALGRAFFAESMFSRRTDASKAALVFLWAELEARGFRVMDCQLHSAHLERMGARNLRRPEFSALLEAAVGEDPGPPGPWDRRVLPVRRPPATEDPN
jgi:leucyl/phenylalanyl-tRNA--protein transferase